MNKITVIKDHNYTVITNAILRDTRLSLKAKGLLVTILGLPPTWDFTIKGICTVLKEGRDAVTTAIDELIECGYCSRINERNETGQFLGYDYTFYEQCRAKTSATESPDTDFPDSANPTQLSKQRLSNQEEKNKNSESDGSHPLASSAYKPSSPKDTRSSAPAITAIRELMKRYPDKMLWDDLIAKLGDTIDTEKLALCRKEWLTRGFNPNALSWVDWYLTGIPTRGTVTTEPSYNKVRNQPTQREAIAAELYEINTARH